MRCSHRSYSAVPDKYLPFEVVREHKTLEVTLEDGTKDYMCDPKRKWSYFYDDSMFSSGTHYVIKNRDVDECAQRGLDPLTSGLLLCSLLCICNCVYCSHGRGAAGHIPSSAVSVSSITSSTSYLYAHGDRRTSQRLRTHIQQGHQIVMLYNSGGITQIFSWLQRVMAHSSSPPSIVRMRDPIELLLSAVPAARGMVGVPESEFARPQTL